MPRRYLLLGEPGDWNKATVPRLLDCTNASVFVWAVRGVTGPVTSPDCTQNRPIALQTSVPLGQVIKRAHDHPRNQLITLLAKHEIERLPCKHLTSDHHAVTFKHWVISLLSALHSPASLFSLPILSLLITSTHLS